MQLTLNIRDGHQLILKSRLAGLQFEGTLIKRDGVVIIAFFGIILSGFKQINGIIRILYAQRRDDSSGFSAIASANCTVVAALPYFFRHA